MHPNEPTAAATDSVAADDDSAVDPRTGSEKHTARTRADAAPDGSTGVGRRDFVVGAAASVGAAAGTVAAGTAATSPAAAQAGSSTTVEMTDQLVFDSDEITVAPGTTVVWETVGTVGHSVTAYEDEIPEDASYFAAGGFETEDAARAAYSPGDPESGDVATGETYEHTFEVEGTYEYFCVPHEGAGMLGTIEVSEDAGANEGASGPVVPQVPDFAKLIGVAVSVALIATVGFTYVFLKYGGAYEPDDPS